jgi:hypothetical protein
VAVYRMHPLMRDNVQIYNIGDNEVVKTVSIPDTREGKAENVLNTETPERLWYSFGITNPGSLTLNNYPNFLRNLEIPLVGNVDLATIDILRDRERGVPRYNQFRRQIGLNPITKFEDLTSDAATLAHLKRLYNNDIEKIDTMVGMMAETVRPDGFAFGETAFQIFILNASRRLMTDRFYTKDYRPEVYTPGRLRLGGKHHHGGRDPSSQPTTGAEPDRRGKCVQALGPEHDGRLRNLESQCQGRSLVGEWRQAHSIQDHHACPEAGTIRAG